MKRFLVAAIVWLPMLSSCETEKRTESRTMPEIPKDVVTETATLAGGCYWCLEAAYRQLDGVHAVTSGFMGGRVKNPTYDQVCAGQTGHAEVVSIVFNPQKISYERLLAWFWDLHDPTTLNRQGNDVGTQYRSAIFYHNETQKKIAEASMKVASANFEKPIVTEITAASQFYPAPDNHQDYYFQNKNSNSYCRFVIEPKLKKLKLDH